MKRLAGKVVYLAGPMTGVPSFNAPAFHAAEERLLTLSGAKAVINPARHPNGLETVHYYELGIIDARHADVVVLLPGWRNSLGVLMELTAREPRFRWHMSVHAIVRLLRETKPADIETLIGSMRLEEREAVELEAL